MDAKPVSLSRSGYFEISLDSLRARKLHELAALTGTDPEILARDLLYEAIDRLEPDFGDPTALLDAIPGAYEHALAGLADIRAGRVVPLTEL